MKTYIALVDFPWRGRWIDKDEPIELMDCEATTLKLAAKISEQSEQKVTKQTIKKVTNDSGE